MRLGNVGRAGAKLVALLAAASLAFTGASAAQAVPLVDAAPAPEKWVDLTAGDDAAGDGSQQSPFKTVAKAQQVLGTTGGTVHVSGTQENIASTVAVNSKVVLDVAANTVFSGTAQPVLKFSAGSSVQTAAGASLTVTNSVSKNNALQLDGTSVMGDGTYNVNGSFTANGKILGSSRQSLNVTVQGKISLPQFASLTRATIQVTDPNHNALTFCPVADDISFTSSGMNVNTNCRTTIKNSDVFIADSSTPDSLGSRIAVNSYGIVNVINSVLTLDGGRLSLQPGSVWSLSGSQLIVQNSTSGALHVNHNATDKSTATFDNSIITTTNVTNTGPTMGVGNPFRYNANGAAWTLTGNSVINTDSTGNDAMGQQNGGKLVVLGGSYLVNPANTTTVSANPTNGPDYGNESLTYFRLANPAEVSSVSVLAKNDATYTYSVANASSDGNKYVWLPAVNVTYELREATASFADGSKGTNGTRVLKTYRGGKLADVSAVTGKEQQSEGAPSAANGRTFAGWKYKDADGVEKDFDPATTVLNSDTTVYATWSGEATNAVVNYVVNSQGDESTTISYPDKNNVTVASYEEVHAQNPQFVKQGHHFSHWSTDTEGNNTVNAGDPIEISGGETPTIYANWEVDTYQVRFSANGGTFAADSVFNADATKDKFEITTDSSGGEIATLKKPVAWNTRYADLFEAVGLDAGNAPGIATRAFYEQKSKKVCPITEVFCQLGWAAYENVSPWYMDAGATDSVNEFSKLSGPVTFYVGWELQEGVPTYSQQNIALEGKLDLQPTSNLLEFGAPFELVRTGSDVEAEGSLDVNPIQEQIQAMADWFTTSGGDENNIYLHGTQSNFVAELTLPDGLVSTVNPPTATLSDNPVFEVTGTALVGNKVSVYMGLKKSYGKFTDLKTDVLSIESDLVVTVNGLKVTAEPPAGNTQDLNASGVVKGKFTGIAVLSSGTNRTAVLSRMSVLNTLAVSRLAAAEAPAATGPAIAFDFGWTSNEAHDIIRVVTPSPLDVRDMPLDANITVTHREVTEDTDVTVVNPTDSVVWNGELDTQPIKDQIRSIAKAHCTTVGIDPATVDSGACHDELETILLKDVDSTFVAELKLPAGVTPISLAELGFTANDLFAVAEEDVVVSGQNVKVTMKLRDKAQYVNLAKLYDAVQATPATLTVSAPATLTDADPGLYTGSGEVTGVFKALAYKASGANAQAFHFEWVTKQREGDKDSATAADDKRVTGTLLVPTPYKVSGTLEGDLVITTAGGSDTTTEHEAVRNVGRGEGYIYDIGANVDVKPIQEQILALAKQYCKDVASQQCQDAYANIALSDVSSSFKAVLELPEGLKLPEQDVLNGITLNDGSLFNIASAERVSDTKLVLTMELNKSGGGANGEFANFKELLAVVTGAAEKLSVTVPQVAVLESAAPNTNLTMTGTLTGDFTGTAHMKGSTAAYKFNFTWDTVQSAVGRDAINEEGDKVITLTVNARATAVPVTKNWVLHNAEIAGETPASVEIQLLSQVGEDAAAAVPGKTLTLSAGDNWAGKFENLNVYTPEGQMITYSVAEGEVPDGYTVAVTGDSKTGFTVTNSLAETSIKVSKKWKGVDAASAPAVEVELIANGQGTGVTKQLSAEGDWSAVFDGIPATKADGTAIDYTVKEKPVPGYTSEVSGDAENGFTVTNTFVPAPQPAEPTTGGLSETGGSFTAPLLAGGLLLAGAAACGLLVWRRRKQEA